MYVHINGCTPSQRFDSFNHNPISAVVPSSLPSRIGWSVFAHRSKRNSISIWTPTSSPSGRIAVQYKVVVRIRTVHTHRSECCPGCPDGNAPDRISPVLSNTWGHVAADTPAQRNWRRHRNATVCRQCPQWPVCCWLDPMWRPVARRAASPTQPCPCIPLSVCDRRWSVFRRQLVWHERHQCGRCVESSNEENHALSDKIGFVEFYTVITKMN